MATRSGPTPVPSDSAATGTDERLRLFLAFDLPQDIRAELTALLADLKKGFQFTPCRPSWVAVRTMHLTLRYLGSTPAGVVEDLAGALAPIAERYPPLELRAGGLGVFPHWRRPRVLWSGIGEATGKLERLQADLEGALVGQGFDPARTPYHPHLTLARFKSPRGTREARPIVQSHARFCTARFLATELILYHSELGPDGARHHPLHRFSLKSG